MMYWFGNSGFGMGFGWLFMILFWLLVIFIVVSLVNKYGSGEKETAEEILKKRYPRKYIAVVFLFLAVLAGCEENSPEGAASRTGESEAELLIAPENRRKMPDFTLSSVQGETVVRSENLRGRVALVVFFTPWCSACVADMAMLQNLVGDYDADRFSVIGMAVAAKDSGKLEPFIKKLGLQFPVLVGDDALQKGFGEITTIPTAFLIDKNGNIARKFVSHLEKDHLTGAIGMLLQEEVQPKL